MRLTEQFSATWSQYDKKRRVIGLSRTKNGTARTVHLNPIAVECVESTRHTGQKPGDLIFPTEDARYSQLRWFQPCLAEAKITGYVWHSSRHTFCSWLAIAGASIKEIQEAAGHKTITMSARYVHLSPEHKQFVVDRLI